MRFSISPTVLQKHPDLYIGVIVATNLSNAPSDATVALLREAERSARTLHTIETFKDHPNLKAMQAIHQSFGNNPNKFPPSAQALLKRVLKGGELPVISPLVDLYNVISLKHVVCVGAEDIDLCMGDIRLAEADGTEHFLPLGETTDDPPQKGELVYKDDAGVICRKLNWREGDRTKVTNETKNAIVVVEGFPPLSKEKLQDILHELSTLVQTHCRANTQTAILSKDSETIAI